MHSTGARVVVDVHASRSRARLTVRALSRCECPLLCRIIDIGVACVPHRLQLMRRIAESSTKSYDREKGCPALKKERKRKRDERRGRERDREIEREREKEREREFAEMAADRRFRRRLLRVVGWRLVCEIARIYREQIRSPGCDPLFEPRESPGVALRSESPAAPNRISEWAERDDGVEGSIRREREMCMSSSTKMKLVRRIRNILPIPRQDTPCA